MKARIPTHARGAHVPVRQPVALPSQRRRDRRLPGEALAEQAARRFAEAGGERGIAAQRADRASELGGPGTIASVKRTFLKWHQLQFSNGQTGWVPAADTISLWDLK